MNKTEDEILAGLVAVVEAAKDSGIDIVCCLQRRDNSFALSTHAKPGMLYVASGLIARKASIDTTEEVMI